MCPMATLWCRRMMTVYVAVSLAALQLAMAGIGELLWLLEGGLAPNRREHLTLSVHSARNCSLSNGSSTVE